MRPSEGEHTGTTTCIIPGYPGRKTLECYFCATNALRYSCKIIYLSRKVTFVSGLRSRMDSHGC